MGYTYDPDDGSAFVGAFKETGEKVTFKANDLELCGKTITFYAYIEKKENEAELGVFHHNRFRWFDRKKIKNELNKREKYPELANQSRTPTCGMASIFYILAKKDFNTYKNFILDLHQTGVAKCNSYNVDVSNSEHLLKMNPVTNSQYPQSYSKMPYIDWIPFSCVRDQENDLLINYNGEMSKSSLDEFSGATLPHEIKKLMKEILGFKNIINDTNLIFNKNSQDFGEISAKELKKLQDLYLEGYDICLFINTNMINNIKSGVFTTIEHWVVFEGIVGGTLSWDEYEFKVFTWGGFENIINNPESFRSNYYGYVAGK
ncbi:hypothetical protein ACSTS3_03255 [Aquimarina muelleri]|uniref:hypothetical protein n=1 Tax=Aquimarina muelleri TaxID=279356 RepID=UPI003F6888D7